MTFGSLFAGIGGLDLGLERAGMTCAWQVEIDDYCNKVLAKHWPDVPRFKDVCEVGKHNLAPVDLICGGFPCQDISFAGKGAGIEEGTRSGLWSEMHRIICELRPRYALMENVSALLVRGLGRVVGDLAESGYNCEWDCIPAAAVGAPHRRDRVFIIAHRRGLRCHAGGAKQPLQRLGQDGEDGIVANPTGAGPGEMLRQGRGLPCEPRRSCWPRIAWATEPDVGRVANGVPARVDRLKGLGNAVVPQVAEYVGRLIMEANDA